METLAQRPIAGTGQDEAAILAAISGYLLRSAPRMASGEINSGTPLLESGVLDSLGILHLMTHLSENFQIEIADEDFVPENFQTAGSLARFVQKKLSERRPE